MAWEVVAYEKWSHIEVRLSEQLAHLKKEIKANAYRHSLLHGSIPNASPFIWTAFDTSYDVIYRNLY